jgi:UPF0755 protein
MASIVEREVGCEKNNHVQDCALVADIFWRRIKAGMPLQSDATVNFVTGKSLLQPTNSDLEKDSPYNTYKYRGLPPGPIGNPGLKSIRATIFPQANEYFYFITDAQGVFHYGKTIEDHIANRQKYLQ